MYGIDMVLFSRECSSVHLYTHKSFQSTEDLRMWNKVKVSFFVLNHFRLQHLTEASWKELDENIYITHVFVCYIWSYVDYLRLP